MACLVLVPNICPPCTLVLTEGCLYNYVALPYTYLYVATVQCSAVQCGIWCIVHSGVVWYGGVCGCENEFHSHDTVIVCEGIMYVTMVTHYM